MKPVNLILLPGMDGTGTLFEPLRQALPAYVRTTVISYPPDRPLGYDELLPIVLQALPQNEPYVLLGESFSGPLALMVAATKTSDTKGVILCASFIRNPLPLNVSWLGSLFSLAVQIAPNPLRLGILLGKGPSDALKRLVSETVSSVSPSVMAFRIRSVIDVDCTSALRACLAPILYISATEDPLVTRNSFN